MKFDNKIPIAVEHHSKLDLPFDHATTGMFMLLQPVYYRHMLRTEAHKMHMVSVVRPNPLVVPTFGRIRQNIRHFFVPYRLIMPNYEEYINDNVASNFSSSSLVSSVPTFSSGDIYELFFTGSYGLSSVVSNPDATIPNYDFTDGTTYWKLTRLGRYFYKILYSLGYDIVGTSKTFLFNALALLAYAKVYCDWYANNAYLNSADYLAITRFFKYNDPTNNLKLGSADLYKILLFIRPAVYNTNPYFEDAWDKPVSPNDGDFSGFRFNDPTSASGSYVRNLNNSNYGTPEMYQASSSSSSLGTSYLHQALQKLSSYQKRHALAGARSIDRVLAQYGLQTDNLRLQRSIYVGVSQQDVDINSIYATANGSNSEGESVVGDFAGAGFGANDWNFDFNCDEEGIFISICTIQPSGGYYQGYDRNNRHLTKEQFFNPEFDALGVQSIEKGEIYVSRNFSFDSNNGDGYAGHFGFTARYGEVKRSLSRVSGDFAFPSVIAGGSAWHLMRSFNDNYFQNSVDNIAHSEDFARGTDAEQYLRLFTYTEYEIDPFNIFIHVDSTSYAPCRPLSDSFDFDIDTSKVAISSTGSKVN